MKNEIISKNLKPEGEVNEYGNGRQSVIDELKHYIDSELGNIQFERRQIPENTKDIQLTHKRANLAGNCIALSRMKQLLRKKENRMKKHG